MARVHVVRPAAWSMVVVGACLLLSARPLAAQSDEDVDSDKIAEGTALDEPAAEEGSGLLGDEQALQEEQTPREDFRETTDPHEEPGQRYYFLGAGWRMFRIPSWIMGAYGLENGPSTGTAAGGALEFAYRKNGFQVSANAGFFNWDFKGPFQLKKDIVQDTEWLDGQLNIFTLSSAVTWSTAFTEWFSIEYGFEAGLGFLLGDVTRSEAVKRGNKWGPCKAWASQTSNMSDRTKFNPDFPNPTAAEREYCDPPLAPSGQRPPDSNASDEEGAHYNVKAKHGLFNGGVPRAVPILGPRASLRFKPVHQLVIRVDIPLPSLPFGFVGGVTAQYGF